MKLECKARIRSDEQPSETEKIDYRYAAIGKYFFAFRGKRREGRETLTEARSNTERKAWENRQNLQNFFGGQHAAARLVPMGGPIVLAWPKLQPRSGVPGEHGRLGCAGAERREVNRSRETHFSTTN